MSDKDKGIKETRDQVEEEEEEREENKISKQQKIPTITTTAPTKDQVRQNSNLSLLLQKQANEQSETQPLLSSSQTRTTNSTIPTYQSTTTTDNKYDDHEHLPTGNNLHKRRSSIQSLPSIQPITKTLSKNQQQQLQQEQQQQLQQQQHRNLRYSIRSLSWKSVIIRPLECIPSVILGLLLNLLDAISYGMITFPLNNPIFAAFGPDGISMFFVSGIIAQLTYSCGGSAFDGVNGSAESIVQSVGADQPERVISSTVVAFALSSILTGIAFFLLGALKLGSLIEFFPRHILVATIGGVGWFLVATGIEVSGRLDENLTYTWSMFKLIFFDGHTFALWFSAFAVAILLRILQRHIQSPMLVPVFFMVLPLAFYLIVFLLRLDVGQVRDDGWIFPLVDSNVPFWHFYTYYNFALVDWKAVAQTLPAMLALTFFGVLHVPINVPALAVSTNMDDIDVNRELVAHGISNAVSGCFGAVQNYLVYTNSLLFIRSGGDSRLAGIMLAGATAILWMIGPWIVGYIPVMVVGSLIFHLGLDLLKEALIDTWNSVHYLEYITICLIIVCMAVLGFVEGIFIGIITACIFFVIQNAKRSETIRATYTGQVMHSTVRRLYRQQLFLNHVGSQIQVIKLQGYLFFGTINQVERTIRGMLDKRAWEEKPIRFLILDLQLVQGLDFSAAEAFVRIRRLLIARQIFMIICNVQPKSDEEKALRKAGMWRTDDSKSSSSTTTQGDSGHPQHGQQHQHSNGYELKCFQYLDDALEWCENVLLKSYFVNKSLLPIPAPGNNEYKFSKNDDATIIDIGASTASPRHQMLTNAVQHILSEAKPTTNRLLYSNMSQPTAILSHSLGELSDQPIPVEFFHELGKYFERCTYQEGETIWHEGDPCEFLIVLEQGSLRSLMKIIGNEKEGEDDDVTVETILPGTVVGELGLFAESRKRTRSLVTEQYSVLWKLTRSSFDRMVTQHPSMATQFVTLTLHFSVDRQDNMTRYAFHLHRY
ncbi:sulfate transporter family-domain-containing protein [Cunninghamella echinulata]|nr:sulfate transporter family-domain-containing protein [Cunninghamella echinulata]